MTKKRTATGADQRRLHPRYAIAALALAATVGCTAYPTLPEPGPNHPANPAATPAPRPAMPDTLAAPAVETPAQSPMDMHEGHGMSGGHRM